MKVTPGSTDISTFVVLRTAADGVTKTGATIADIDLQYCRLGAAPAAKVDATALAGTDTAHTDNYGIEIDATDQPGLYRIDWPDAAFATGVREVILSVKLATCFTEHIRVELETRQTGDSYAIVNGDHGLVSIQDDVDTLVSTCTETRLAQLDEANMPTDIDNIFDDVGDVQNTADAILTDTNELELDWKDGGRLDLLLDAAQVAGTGAVTWTYTVTLADTTPVGGVAVWVTSDIAGTTVLASGLTNASGVVTFYLDAGTVYVWCKKDGYTFTNPDTETVA